MADVRGVMAEKKPYNPEVARRAQIPTAELFRLVAERLRGTAIPTDPAEKQKLIGATVLRLLYERYQEELKLEEMLGSDSPDKT